MGIAEVTDIAKNERNNKNFFRAFFFSLSVSDSLFPSNIKRKKLGCFSLISERPFIYTETVNLI